jgi:hypothetical protein
LYRVTGTDARRLVLSRRRRWLFAIAAVALAIVVPSCAVIAADVYLHGKYQTSAGYNVWGYRGPAVGRKREGSVRLVVVGGSTVYGYGVNWDQAIPARLERRLIGRSARPIDVVNLGYNNEGAYSMKFTLSDYAYLQYDLAVLYEGYNDLNQLPEKPNLSAFRRDSPVFRFTGYLPIFPMVFKEKAAAMLHGGDAGALYRASDKTVFHPSLAQRAAAGVLNATAGFGQSVEHQLDVMTAEPTRQVVDATAMGCVPRWRSYCRSMYEAVSYAVGAGKRVLVVGQPLPPDKNARRRHAEQQRELEAMMARFFADNPRVRYFGLGTTLDLDDPAISFDEMHLTPQGNERVAEALVAPILDILSEQQAAIEPLDVVDEPIDAVARQYGCAPALAHRAPLHRVVEEGRDGTRERVDVAGPDKNPGIGAADDVADAAHIRAHTRDGRRQTFDERNGRAFVARREQENIRRAVDHGQIAAPPKKPRALAEATVARGRFERSTQLAVAGDQEERAGIAIEHSPRRLQEQVMLFDGRQAADRGDDLRVAGNRERRARAGAVSIVHCGQRGKIEAEGNDAVLLGPADAIVRQQLVLDVRRDRDNRVARARKLALGGGEDPRGGGPEVPLQDVPVVGVYDARGCPPARRSVVGERRKAADDAGLRHVRMHNRRLEVGERSVNPRQCDRVVSRSDRTPQVGHIQRVDACARQEIAHVALAGTKTPVDEKRFASASRQPVGQGGGLNGGPPNVQARDDSRDPHRSDDITRLLGERQR